MVNSPGEAMGREPLDHGIGIEERPVDSLRRRAEHPVKADGAGGREASGDLLTRLLGDSARIKNGVQVFLVHVATNGVLHATAEERAVLDVFTCTREHTHLDAAGRRLLANAVAWATNEPPPVRLSSGQPNECWTRPG